MARAYFGTDGIRGRVGEGVITPEFAVRLGWAAGKVLSSRGTRKVLIGKDTRISGYLLESALEAGFSAAGVDVALTGPMPTPAIAYLTRTFRAEAGVVISASHNPYYDNGIKFFSADGTKLADDIELAIEAMLAQPIECAESHRLGKATRIDDAAGRYIEFCKSHFPGELTLSGVNLVLDCAHGAGYHIAPAVFSELGAKVHTLGVSPNGLNINDGVGATAPEALAQRVVAEQAQLGIALDGDGDRLIMVDATGQVVDGDQLLYVLAKDAQQRERAIGGVVGTLMTNMALEQRLAQMGLPFTRAKVGDRYVMETLKERGWRLGGESSGHLLDLDHVSTGDGIVAALLVVAALLRSGQSLAQAVAECPLWPQVLINVPYQVGGQDPLKDPQLRAAEQAAQTTLAGQGRVLLRKSGTEPVLRVMVEGADATLVQTLAQGIANSVK
ncbi:phosphoglucosamine mutase [Ferrimonas balearica]|uniref:phosphoglucosamine mutase n=1 Tax=Ferrimonas balearica TaxID=44012 RepID=UPI001C98F248|nr:phosphoglucosamine mutase [Ferrimonas balearica]MBY5992695.1 phosphoglucosamine mutase [Ferrimonas balearica]